MKDDDSSLAHPAKYRVNDFIGVAEAARIIGVSPRTIHKWFLSRRLVPIISPSGHRRYRRSTVVAFANRYQKENGSITDGDVQKAVFLMFRAAESRGAQTQMIHRDVVIELGVSIAVVRELWAEYQTALGAPVLVNKRVQVTPEVDKRTAKKQANAKIEEAHDRELDALDARHAEREVEEEAAHQAHLTMLRGGQ